MLPHISLNQFNICILILIIYATCGFSLILKPGTDTFNTWRKNSQPRIVKIVIYNWTNPEDIQDEDIKPKFEEIGPYVFSESIEKTDIIWNDNETVTYKEKRTWWYEPEQSNGSLDDVVISVNPVAVQIGDSVKNRGYFMKKGLEVALNAMSTKLFISAPVREFLFDGYDDPILDFSSKVLSDKQKIPNKFAYFYKANGTDDLNGVFNIENGVNGQLGQLNSWNFENSTSFYSDSCSSFEGSSAGDFFPSNLTKNSTIKVFAVDLCRKLEFEFDQEVDLNGSIGYKFVAGDRFLDNGDKIPENECFCNGKCLPYGVLDVSACKLGPVYVSLPHFYKADPSYLEVLDGIKTSSKADDVYMVFDPESGVPLDYSLGLQINLRIRPVKYIRLFENLPDILLPVFYIQENKA